MAGIKFFEMSWSDITRTMITTTVDSNSAQKDYLINRDPIFDWKSSGANNDSTTVTYTVDLGVSRTFDHLFLKDTNLKDFSLEYHNGVTWVSILSETAHADDFYYKAFSDITAQNIRLKMNKTQVAHQEKTIGEFIITNLIGQLVGYPEVTLNNELDTINKEMLSGRKKTVYDGQSVTIDLNFKTYPNAADGALFQTLYNKKEAFLIWLCGGDESQFDYADEGYRLQDIYLVAVNKPYKHNFTKGYYSGGMNAVLSMSEQA